MKKYLILLLVIAFAVSIVVTGIGCKVEAVVEEAVEAVEEAAEEVMEEAGGERIALINPFYSLGSYQIPFVDSAIATGKAMGAEVILFDAEMNGEKQFDQAKQAIADGFDGIFIVPLDPATGAKIVQICQDAGVPLATSTTDVDEASRDLLDVRVGISGQTQGEAIAKYVADVFKDDGPLKAVIITGTPDVEVSQARTAGFKIGVEGTNIEIVAEQSADFDKAKALAIMENFLVTMPEVTIVFGHDDQMAAGAVEAIEAAGNLDEIIVTGIGGNKEGLQMVADNKIFVSFIQEPHVEAALAVDALLKIIRGEEVEFTKGNYIELPRTLITKDNYTDYDPKW